MDVHDMQDMAGRRLSDYLRVQAEQTDQIAQLRNGFNILHEFAFRQEEKLMNYIR